VTDPSPSPLGRRVSNMLRRETSRVPGHLGAAVSACVSTARSGWRERVSYELHTFGVAVHDHAY
jgi:hypothetical protein